MMVAEMGARKATLAQKTPRGSCSASRIRRTVATKMGEMHVPPDYIARVLDHSFHGEPRLTHKHYLKYAFRDEKRYALTAWANHLMGLVGKLGLARASSS